MSKAAPSNLQIVWLKRDLRIQDHQAFVSAQARGPVMAIYILEPEWQKSPEFSQHHLMFVATSLNEIENQLQHLNIPFLSLCGEATSVLRDLQKQTNFKELHSHMETGLGWSFERDLRVKQWCRSQGVRWHEYKQFAVHRGLKDRNLWNTKRSKIINRETYPKIKQQNTAWSFQKLKEKHHPIEVEQPNFQIQKGGSKQAHELLQSFLGARGEHYSSEMSSPNTAYEACSRLSTHIAWGTISLSEINSELKKAQRELQNMDFARSKQWRRSLKAFESRLWWHCHFIQKLESEPEIEFYNMNRGYDGMREPHFNPIYFEAWKKGETGFPFVDACMRALQKTGWINFRMRAMLISFASYQLWLHWRKTGTYLAQLFTDFEPGIHYSQIQMQSGVTGINTLRIYSPIKQAMDQDPKGDFIRRFCPELEGVDDSFIHQPQLMPPMIQKMSGCEIGKDYPSPIIDHKEAYNKAKTLAFQWRGKKTVRTAAREVYRRHGSRKNSFFPKQQRIIATSKNHQE